MARVVYIGAVKLSEAARRYSGWRNMEVFASISALAPMVSKVPRIAGNIAVL
jgi:hypothetical protein